MTWNVLLYVLAAAALLGSPGPGIGALVAVGRSFPPIRALRFYGSMQIGLALAAGVSAAGLAGLLTASTWLHLALSILSTLYLLWLAWMIGTAPVGDAVGTRDATGLTDQGAFFLGVANPKAYLAFASLFGSFTLLPVGPPAQDTVLKLALCIAVMSVVDLAWLALGMAFGKVAMSPPVERGFNAAMALVIVSACVATWL